MTRMRRAGKWSTAAGAAVPAVLLLFFSFSSGGFFPGAPALAALVLAVALVLRLTLARQPLAGCSPALAVAVGALALFAAWTLLSATWSDATGRALLEYDRALAYVLALALLGTLPRTPGTLAWAVRWLALAILAVCVAGLATRLLPDTFPIAAGAAEDRLAFPLTYWNALGIVGAIGAVLLVHLTSSVREPAAVRVLAAAALPVVVVTIYFTFSRGAMGAGVLGLLAYLVVGRPAGWYGLAPAAAAAVAVVLAALGADALSSDAYATRAGLAEGRDLLRVLGLAALGAAVVRAALVPLDSLVRRRADARRAWPLRRTAAGWAGAAVVAGVVLLAVGAPAFVERQYERFVEGDVTTETDQRDRLLNPGNNGRINHWRVAKDAFETQPLRGTGAGTYETAWAQDRTVAFEVVDAHSLYVEVLAELGVVGFALLIVALGAILGGLLWLARGPERGPAAALFAAGGLWAVHAGIDWDWEMPATGLWLFAVGGLALAAPRGEGRMRAPGRIGRVALALGVLVLALTPLQVMRSQGALRDAIRAFDEGDCAGAIDASLASLDAVRARPEPFMLMGFCDVRLGYDELAVRNLEQATARDPRSWEAWYGLALVRGAVGEDPRAAAARARELNPLGTMPEEAVEAFATGGRSAWERRARRLRLPLG